jgi:hypothetical protein
MAGTGFHSVVANRAQMCTADHGIQRTVKLPLEKLKYVFVNQQLFFKKQKHIMYLITHVSLIQIQISKTERCVADVAL